MNMTIVAIIVFGTVFLVILWLLLPSRKAHRKSTRASTEFIYVTTELVPSAFVCADEPNVTDSTSGSYLRENQYRLYDLVHNGDHLVFDLLTHKGSFKCLVEFEEDNLDFIREAVAWWEASKLSTPSPVVIVNIKQ